MKNLKGSVPRTGSGSASRVKIQEVSVEDKPFVPFHTYMCYFLPSVCRLQCIGRSLSCLSSLPFFDVGCILYCSACFHVSDPGGSATEETAMMTSSRHRSQTGNARARWTPTMTTAADKEKTSKRTGRTERGKKLTKKQVPALAPAAARKPGGDLGRLPPAAPAPTAGSGRVRRRLLLHSPVRRAGNDPARP